MLDAWVRIGGELDWSAIQWVVAVDEVRDPELLIAGLVALNAEIRSRGQG